MAFIRGVEVGKVLLTPEDVLEHCYPEMHKRNQALKVSPSEAASADPSPIVAPVAPPVQVAVKPGKTKKVKAESEPPKAEVDAPKEEESSEPPKDDVDLDAPFKDV